MKKHHFPRGKRMAVRLLAVIFAAAACYTSHAIITRSNDAFSRNLGKGFNHGLIAVSKLGMGLSQMYAEMSAEAKPLPQAAARHITVGEQERSLLQRWNRTLAISSRNGFVAGAKVEIYGH